MTHAVNIPSESEALYVRVHGEASFSTFLHISKELVQTCQEQQVQRAVLDMQDITGSIGVADIYYLAKQLRELVCGSIIRMATVHSEDEPALKDFFELTASNRGLPLKTFFEPLEALAWLRDN